MITAEEVQQEATGASAPDLLEEFHSWLGELVERDGSDLHLKVGAPPKIRRTGRLEPMARAPLTPDETEAVAQAIVPADRRARFETAGEVDFAYSVPQVCRFRVNVFRQRGSTSLVFRKLRFGGPTFEELHLPDVVRKLSEEPRGLVLVTGPTGSGKTTTLSAMIEHVNRTKQVHIVTIEGPIEVLFKDDQASASSSSSKRASPRTAEIAAR